MPHTRPTGSLLLASILGTAAGCGATGLGQQPDKHRTLKDAYAGRFLVGTCVSTRNLRGDAETDNPTMRLIAQQFSAVTPENCMKWQEIHPEPGRYDFSAADRLVGFAEAHGIAVFGHTLIWHNQTPDWVFEDEAGQGVSRDVLIDRMRDHIHTVVGRYKGRVHAWDVVNEPVRNSDKDGDQLMRTSRWRTIIGDDYLALAHRFAHEADPDAVRIFNDYWLVNDAKRGRYVALARQLLDQGVPIHAVGIQGHWGPDHPDASTLTRMLDDIGALGLPIHITELDHNLFHHGDRSDPYADGLPPGVAQQQAKMYATWFTLFAERSDRIDRVSFWGPHDGQTWLNHWPRNVRRSNHPLLFDRQLQPKPAFDAAINPTAYLESTNERESNQVQ